MGNFLQRGKNYIRICHEHGEFKSKRQMSFLNVTVFINTCMESLCMLITEKGNV